MTSLTYAHEKGEATVDSGPPCVCVEKRRIKRTQEVSKRDRKGFRLAALGEIDGTAKINMDDRLSLFTTVDISVSHGRFTLLCSYL